MSKNKPTVIKSRDIGLALIFLAVIVYLGLHPQEYFMGGVGPIQYTTNSNAVGALLLIAILVVLGIIIIAIGSILKPKSIKALGIEITFRGK